MNNVISEIDNKDLCSGCGVCAGICPANALTMSLQENGDLVPFVDESRCLDKCTLCLEICPFTKGFHNPREKNIKLFNQDTGARYNDAIGWYNTTYVGYRVDEALRKTSASGGLVTWCLESLFNQGHITKAALVRLAKNNEKGFFEFYEARSVADLRNSSGSFYHPVEISQIIRLIAADDENKWAIVGVPCLCAAVRNVPKLKKKVTFVLGLACGMYQNTFYTEMLLAASGVDRRNIINIEYRRKSDGVSPSDFRFRGTDNRGLGKEVAYHGLPYYLGNNAFFRLNTCNFCMDVFAETADACFMDAWLHEYSQESKGTSLVVIRDRLLNELFQMGNAEHTICISPIAPEKIIESQTGHVRRKKHLIFMRMRKQNLLTGNIPKPSFEEKIAWRIQKYAQTRSKDGWAKYGRKNTIFAFWISITDILFMQQLLKMIFYLMYLFKKVLSRSLRISLV